MFDPEEILGHLGNPGPYQVFIYFLVAIHYTVMSYNNLNMAVYGATNPHHCKLPENITDWMAIPNVTNEHGETTFKSCEMYVNYTYLSNKTQPCPRSNGWHYTGEPREWNIIMEWDLVCDQSYLKGLSTTIYFVGVMLGGLIFGTLSDKVGRKPTFLLTLWGQMILGIILSFMRNLIAFIVVRFFMGAFLQGMQAISISLVMEFARKKLRTLAGTICAVLWVVGIWYLALIAWLIRDWHGIQLCLSLHSVVTILYFSLIPESIRWQVTNNKINAAEKTLVMLAKRNRVKLPPDPFKKYAIGAREQRKKEEGSAKKSYSALDLFRTPEMRKRIFVMGYIWVAISIGYYGLSLNVSSLAGNIYLNVFIMGVTDLPGYLVNIYLLERFGRRKPLFAYQLIGGIMCIVAAVVPARTASGADIRMLGTGIALAGKFGMAASIGVVTVYTSELFPTVIRNVSVSACAFMARLGGVIAPQILLLGELTYAKAPFIIFGCISILGAALTFLLPETLNRTLPDTIQDIELKTSHSPDENTAPDTEGKENQGFSTDL